MNIDSIDNGYVIDHIQAGKSMEIYKYLALDLDVLGYIDPSITVNVIKDGQLIEKKPLALPERLTNVIKCKNPRCITSTEQELDQVFFLADRDKRIYRCVYCESKSNEYK